MFDDPQAAAATLLLGIQGVVVLAGLTLWARGVRIGGSRRARVEAWHLTPLDAGVVLIATVLMVIFLQISLFHGFGLVDAPPTATARAQQMLVGILSLQLPFIAAYLLIRQFQSEATRREIGLDQPQSALKHGLIAFLLLMPIFYGGQILWIGLIHAINALFDGLIPLHPQEVIARFFEAPNAIYLILMVLGAVVLAPIAEELFFRAGIYRVMKGWFGSVPAALFSSACFSALHQHIVGLFPLFLLGCLLCYSYERSGRILSAIIFHACFNALSLLQIYITWKFGLAEAFG